MSTLDAIGERVRRAREQRGLSQRALERRLGVAKSWASQLESGRRLPSVVTLRELAIALGVSADYLLGLDAAAEGDACH